jgi:hypothetical protein
LSSIRAAITAGFVEFRDFNGIVKRAIGTADPRFRAATAAGCHLREVLRA